jgi:hypothetical protein
MSVKVYGSLNSLKTLDLIAAKGGEMGCYGRDISRLVKFFTK